jgi:hypothetical protein
MGENKAADLLAMTLDDIKKPTLLTELAMASITTKLLKPMLSQTTDVILDQK